MIDTALRECFEEIGLPSDLITVQTILPTVKYVNNAGNTF